MLTPDTLTPDLWIIAILAVCLAAAAFLVARGKNRSQAAWPLFTALATFLFYPLGIILLVILTVRRHITLREKYLQMKFEERFAAALRLPSPISSVEDRVLATLVFNPQGVRIGALGHGVGANWRAIEPVLKRLVAEGKVRSKGDLYFFNIE
ncbi:hypothetical protein ACFL4G_03995 [Thermodesulfobacteriota bacterium]